MKSHLNILINDKPVTLPDGFSIDIEDQNPVFYESEMFSYPFTIPMEGNRWLVKNIDDIHASLRAVNLEHLPTRINADGLPFRSGTIVMQDGDEIKGTLSMNIDAGTQSFNDLIANLDCRDVPLKDTLIIGEKIGNVRVDIESDPVVRVQVHVDGDKNKDAYDETREIRAAHVSVSKVLEPQALGFSCPASCVEGNAYNAAAVVERQKSYPDGTVVNVPKKTTLGNYINTSAAYGETDGAGRAAAYCNARVCYKHHGLTDEGETSDDTIKMDDCTWTNEDLYPYWVLDADRPQSGICFYVLYFLDCLFQHLGVTFDKSALLAIEDMKHLCFFTTVCAYDTIEDREADKENGITAFHNPHVGTFYTAQDEEVISKKKRAGEIKTGFFTSQDQINEWLYSRGCGGQINIVKAEDKEVQELTLKRADTGASEFIEVGQIRENGGKVTGITINAEIQKFSCQANVLYMVANSDNFPDESVSTVIEALKNAFGIKFSYDYEQKKVTAYLLRDVMRNSGEGTRTFHCDIHEFIPISEKITGVRMRYSEEEDAKEQRKYIKEYNKNKNTNYETDYNYTDYREPGSGDNSVILDRTYVDFFHNLDSGDKHCYIDKNTGNAYRIKVNGDATTTADLKPVLFEVGQYKGVEYGDCSDINEDFIHNISVGFTPVPFNDVNYFKEVEAAYGSHTGVDTVTGIEYGVKIESGQPLLCAYVDKDMEHEFVEQLLNMTISTAFCDFYMQQKLKLVESYDPSGTDDGNSPLQDDSRWGFSLAMMRGGGSDATQEAYAYNYDGFGNSKWRTKAGKYALACDSLDCMGNLFDYNGVRPGLGNGERFSLKIRAYKEPSWLSKPQYKGVELCNPDIKDENGNTITKIKSRGLFDTFMLPYAYFLLNRKKFIVKCTTTVAQLADITNHWHEWWNIGDMKCLIDKVNTTISAQDGLGEVELTVYAL